MPRSILRCTLSTACVALLATTFPAQGAEPEYGIREERPQPGSLLRHYDVSRTNVPINRRYSELTPEERQYVRAYYEKIEPNQEPPFPSEGLKPVMQAILKGQRALLVKGELILIASVSPEGDVTEVKAIGAPDAEMVRFAASVIAVTKFKPATCDGKPCRMDFPFRFNFQ